MIVFDDNYSSAAERIIPGGMGIGYYAGRL